MNHLIDSYLQSNSLEYLKSPNKNFKFNVYVYKSERDLRLLDVNSQLNDWSMRANNCMSISFESWSRERIEFMLFWTRLSIRFWVVSNKNINKSLNSLCWQIHFNCNPTTFKNDHKITSKSRLAVKCESLDRPNLVERLVLENSFNNANMSEQHICF